MSGGGGGGVYERALAHAAAFAPFEPLNNRRVFATRDFLFFFFLSCARGSLLSAYATIKPLAAG